MKRLHWPLLPSTGLSATRNVLLLALPLVLALAGSASAQEADPPPSWCVAVWYPSSEHPGGAASVTANLDVIDIVHQFWFTPAADGRILSQAGANWREQVDAWRAAGALVMPSIFSTISGYLQEPLLTAHLGEILALAEEHDFDGIDIDYEMFPLATREPFSEFIERLAAGLHAQGRLLAVTVHAKTSSENAWDSAMAQDWERLSAAADMFNVMTYDWTNRNEPPGPIAPISWVSEVVTYGLGVVEADKLGVGIPFYGYTWLRGRPPATAITWEAANRMVVQFGLEPERDDDSHELEILLTVPGLPRQDVWASDATTLAARLAALPEYIGGIAIWGLGGEDPGNWEVLAANRPAPCLLARPAAP